MTILPDTDTRVLSQTDRGKINPGYKADLVMLSSDMEIQKVFKAE